MSRVRAFEHLIVPSLRKSAEEGRFEELCRRVEAGSCLFLEGCGAVLVVELIQDADGGSFNIWIVGGVLAEAITFLPGLEALARAYGCPFVSFGRGRRGWRRVMAPLGYAWVGHEFRKAL